MNEGTRAVVGDLPTLYCCLCLTSTAVRDCAINGAGNDVCIPCIDLDDELMALELALAAQVCDNFGLARHRSGPWLPTLTSATRLHHAEPPAEDTEVPDAPVR